MMTPVRFLLVLALLLPCLLSAMPQMQSFRVAPSYFPNKGQVSDKSVTWYSRGANVSLYLRGTTLTYVLHHRPKSDVDDPMKRPHDLAETASIVDRVDVELVGANPRYEIQAEAPQAGVFHFYLPQCSPGLRDVPHYGRLVCRDVWPGVDLVLGVQGDALKYDFVVQPGADAGQIRLRYAGQGPLLTPDGGLTRPTAAGDLRESAPTAWTTSPDGSRTPVAASWQLAEDGSPRFALGAYDATQPLTIDPVVWGMYLGGSGGDQVNALCPAPEGGVFVGGVSSSIDFVSFICGPKGENYDGYLLCFSAAGDLNWGSCFGGSEEDRVLSLCPDANRGLFVVGGTSSNDFEGLSGSLKGNTDGYLACFSAAGDFTSGRYIGGSLDDYVSVLCSAPNGGVFAGGGTSSNDFEGLNGSSKGGWDGLLMHFSATGDLIWVRLFGGQFNDFTRALCSAPEGGVFAGGQTQSNDFEGLSSGYKGGYSNGFLVRFTVVGDLVWGTYLGGSSDVVDNGWSSVNALCPDLHGDVFVGGSTSSNAFEGLSGKHKGLDDGFLMRFSDAGILIWGKYLGGCYSDVVNVISTASDGGIFAGGGTSSNDFEGLNGGNKGGWDGLLMRCSADGDLVWGEFLGGKEEDMVRALCNAPNGGVLAGGQTRSLDFEGLRGRRMGDFGGFLLKHTGTTSRSAPQAPLPLSLAPNPTTNEALITLDLASNSPATLEAFDAAGRLVHSRRLDLLAGENRISLDVAAWPVGVYALRLRTDRTEYAGRLVKN